jgi:hypothetical protein
VYWLAALNLALLCGFFVGFVSLVYHLVMLNVTFRRAGRSLGSDPWWSSDLPQEVKVHRRRALISWAIGFTTIVALLYSCAGGF